MSVEERVKREKYSHENDDVLQESLKLKSKYSHILSYPGYKLMTSRFEKSYENLSKKVVLDFGCGKGLDSLKLLKAGAICSIEVLILMTLPCTEDAPEALAS